MRTVVPGLIGFNFLLLLYFFPLGCVGTLHLDTIEGNVVLITRLNINSVGLLPRLFGVVLRVNNARYRSLPHSFAFFNVRLIV